MIPEIYKASPERYSNGMRYRRCGNSGVLLPEISLGLWHNFGAVDPLSRSEEIVHEAFDSGITHFDLANNYGPYYGSAEETFGRIMEKSLRPYRDELFISSKAGYDMWPGPYGNWGSRKYLMASIRQSLKRMNLEYVDLFYTHRFDPETPVEETFQALVDIVRQGLALYVGISRWPREETERAFAYLRERDVPCLIYQGKENIYDREPLTSGVLQTCADSGCGFISFSPLAQGLLTNRYLHGIPGDSRMAHGGSLTQQALTPQRLESIKALDALAQERGQSLAQMAIAWVLADKRVTSVIVGASSTGQLRDNLRALQSAPFSEAELREIDRLSADIK